MNYYIGKYKYTAILSHLLNCRETVSVATLTTLLQPKVTVRNSSTISHHQISLLFFMMYMYFVQLTQRLDGNIRGIIFPMFSSLKFPQQCSVTFDLPLW
jgi:hypothetical protein